MEIAVLGAGAGGGFPQWNSRAPACERARNGDPQALPCTQASIAVSADGANWFIVNASPDLRTQIEHTAELHPRVAPRSTPIAGVVLTGAEVDTIAGLLNLRERQAFGIFATAETHARLDANPIFDVLARDVVRRVTLQLNVPHALNLPDGSASGLVVIPFAVPGKVPLYAEAAGTVPQVDIASGETIGLEIENDRIRLLFVPGCARLTPELRERMDGADCVFFDGTLWEDDEMVRAGLGTKTGRRMGHMSISGPGGVIESLGEIPIARKFLIHINNSNPVLLSDSAERQIAHDAGWGIAFDGMRLSL